jgi:hypothetical protein
LQALIKPNALPVDDPLFAELAGERPWVISDVSQNAPLLGRLSKEGSGLLEWLDNDNAVEGELPSVEFEHSAYVKIGMQPVYNIAARFQLTDGWVSRAGVTPHTHPALYASRTGTCFAVPWCHSGRPIAVWLFDVGCWQPTAYVPRVAMLGAVHEILQEFGADFAQTDWSVL